MSLNDLIEHVKTQEEAIGNLSFVGVSYETRVCAAWDAFRKSIWGKGLEAFQESQLVQRDTSNQAERVVSPADNYLVATIPTIPGGNQDNRQILVRSEYYEAARTAVLLSGKRYRDVFVVTGQPGIGKSVFIRWLLMCRLALGLPTALQIDSSYAILFHGRGVLELQNFKTGIDYDALNFPRRDPSRRIWALVDSNPQLLEPAGIFMHQTSFFVVDAVSSCSKHLEWLKKLGHEKFYMEPWSLSEVIQARRFLGGHTERQLRYLYEKFGASPRELVFYANVPAQYETLLHQEIDQLDPDCLHLIFRSPVFCGSSSLIITTKPSSADRLSFKRVVASRHVLNLLWEKHISHRADLMRLLYDQFQAYPTNPPAAEWIFKLRIHQLLVEKQTLQLFPIRGYQTKANLIYDDHTASRKRQDPTNLELVKSEQYRLVEKHGLQKNCYYVPKCKRFPGIDSLLLVHPPGEALPILLMFRIIQNQKDYSVNKKSLGKVGDLKLPSNTRKYYVVVTPEGVRPTITVPTKYPQNQEQQETSDSEETSTDEDEEPTDGDLEMSADEDQDQISVGSSFSVFHHPVRAELFTAGSWSGYKR